MRILCGIPELALAAFCFTSPLPEAPAGPDNKVNVPRFTEAR
jgi:hypothetical protein